MTSDAPDDPQDRSDAAGAESPDDAASHRAEADESERIPDEAPQHTALWVLLSRWLLGAEAWLRSHGGRGLRLGLLGFWSLVALAGVVLLIGPVINKPLSLDDITGSAAGVTDRWIAREFAVDYRLSRTPDGALTARVEERISANFPEGTDERGIQRMLASQYQGHALDPSDVEATLDGMPVDVGRSETADTLTLTMDAAQRLQGDHVFVLSYDLSHLAYPATDTATGQPVDLLQWDVFGPSWPQGLAGLDVTVTMPDDLDGQLIRQPRGSLAWTIVGTGEWLDPEPGGAADEVSYRFTNDQRLPPHAQAWFTMSFEPGTFAMPAPTPLYWVQTFGPLAPLAFLLATLLLAFAARAVAWGDARGRPWFVAQSDPPKDVTPRMAAQILRTPATMELAEALEAARKGARGTERRARMIEAARVARRTGRIGDRPRALSRYLAASERRRQLKDGLRRIPRGFVRDLFIAAPLALTIVQWGIVRQLSYQVVLAVVWWPFAFVVVSSAIAAVIVWIALSSRPLTRRGALVRQYLLGIGVHAERTRLLDRGSIGDRALPYAVLLEPPRSAGARVVERIEGELGEADASSRWRTQEFLTGPRLLIRALSVVLVAGAITAVSALPGPYPQSDRALSYSGDVPGTLWTKVQSVDVVGELSRADDGRARVDVTERLEVSFSDEGSRVPQFAQEWPNRLDGQDLGLRVESVTIDGREVPFTTQQEKGTLLMSTALAEVITGSHEVQLDYALESAAAAVDSRSGVVDRVRWAALLDGWEYDSQWGEEPVPDPIRVELRVDDELAALATASGWISRDAQTDQGARDWKPSIVPFDAADAATAADAAGSADGARSHVLELTENEFGGWPFELTVDDVGVSLDFPAGTFAGPDADAMRMTQLLAILPVLVVVALGLLAFGLGAASVIRALARRGRRVAPGPFRDLLWWLTPSATLAAIILFVWATSDMPPDYREFAPLGLSTLAALLGCAAALTFTRPLTPSRE
ncbi:DUF2207 domain-containing protein [Compostimonas suwonensis]|uniref:Putative membrane protein DUF2207 n=1 Tax=Compostimonas suwonensis TaxID=1048394 RepID=A0A2M9BWQ8_9MICO|nr:DUF2207 domain-containing protein [Compostimonas suwonensis]PJJ62397.1 putative membrane protein DUF2207 [Compostimonas suwonensis]